MITLPPSVRRLLLILAVVRLSAILVYVLSSRPGANLLLIRNEAWLIVALVSWVAMFRFFPALRDKGLAHLQTRRGFVQAFGLGILSGTTGAGLLSIIIVGRNLPFTALLGVFVLGCIQLTAGIVFAALGGQCRTLLTGDSRAYPWYDLVIGTQLFALCLVFKPLWVIVLGGLLIPALGLFTRLVFFPDRP
jgi:hypothetical protein